MRPLFLLLCDPSPCTKRPTANGIFASAVYIGGGLASLSEAMAADSLGWRATMFICAGCGTAVALLMVLTVAEPRRQVRQEGLADIS